MFGSQIHRCALGRAGIAMRKEEGDHATPSGLLKLRRVLYRADRVSAPLCAVPREPIAPADGWCDDSTHPAYNTKVALPFDARHEFLWREDSLYDVIGVLGWNDTPVQRWRGSAIFLHVARNDLAPTQGCIALPLTVLMQVLAQGLTAVEVVLPG